jgi:hypothetical protein
LYNDLKYWADKLNIPIFIADSARTRDNESEGHKDGKSFREHDSAKYEETLKLIREIPECVGFHLCGAYAQNFTRRYGLKNYQDIAETETAELARINKEMIEWIK